MILTPIGFSGDDYEDYAPIHEPAPPCEACEGSGFLVTGDICRCAIVVIDADLAFIAEDQRVTPAPACAKCNDTGETTTYDSVDYGSTVVSMPSTEYCECAAGIALWEREEEAA